MDMWNMRIASLLGRVVALAVVIGLAAPALGEAAKKDAAKADGFVSIFNGKDLTEWDGEPGWWTVENGALTAVPHEPSKSTYITWRGGQPSDFDLRLEYRLANGNSGVQFRSRQLPKWQISGYQADMEAGNRWSGCLFQHARGGVSMRGEKTVIAADGEKKVTPIGDAAKLLKKIKKNEWNEYRIVARGSDIKMYINGALMAHAIDNEKGKAARSGIIGFQIHPGPAMKVQFRNIRLKQFPPAKKKQAPKVTPSKPAGKKGGAKKANSALPAPKWIWTSPRPKADQTAYFRKEFQINGGVTGAKLFITCDDEWQVFLDGQVVAKGDLWKEPTVVDITKAFGNPGDQNGRHTVAVRGHNRGASPAGLLMRLVVQGRGSRATTIVTDESWRASLQPKDGWQKQTFDHGTWPVVATVGKLGDAPWGPTINETALRTGVAQSPSATSSARPVRAIKDFNVELLYSANKTKEGSWVSMCADPKGRLYVCDQYEHGLYRITPAPLGSKPGETKVEKLKVDVRGAQGLVWAADSLYVLVSKNRGTSASGLYRVRDTNGDDQLDAVELLRPLEGGGDHGWHGLLAAPDGKSIYVVAGNNTKGPRGPGESSRVSPVWSEDQLLPRLPDARGHMAGLLAPGGCIYRVDLDGKKWELIVNGFRNTYDAALHRDGDLFTFDADMEWDVGLPWYRPTRVCHITSGAEFGWRNGMGKWPAYYPDSLPAVVDVGRGSPTGVCFGYGAKFPAKYQNAFYICDWTYGKLFAVHLRPEGSSYRGEVEEFIVGKPLPLTDVLISPTDGAMYFIGGGWKNQTHLYRVTYSGDEPTEASKKPATNVDARCVETRALRRRLESFHGRQDSKAVDAAWPYLGHADRFIRFAARVALEWQDPTAWRERALAERDPQTALGALLALVRVSARDEFHRKPTDPAPNAALQARLIESLGRIDWEKLADAQRLELLRVYAVTFTRLGEPDETLRGKTIARLDPLFPAPTRPLNAELCQLLVYLNSSHVIQETLNLLAKAPTQEEQIHYVRCLRVAKGWTLEQRQNYFSWFVKATGYQGGNSFAGYLRNMKADAVASLTEAEKKSLEPILKVKYGAVLPEALTTALAGRSVVKEWKVNELAPLVQNGLTKRDFDQGRKMFVATGCFSCHRMNGEGGVTGPDLTTVAGRFSPRDMLVHTIEPSTAMDEKYAPMTIRTIDGDVIIGRVTKQNAKTVWVNTDMFNPLTTVQVNRGEIESMAPSKLSPMPQGLLNVLHREEIADLMAYLLSGGDRTNGMFGR